MIKCFVNTLEIKLSEKKHLYMQLFHKNKDGRSKDQSKNKFYLILPSMKTNKKRIFFHGGRKFRFWSLKESLGNPFNGCSFCLQLLKRLFCFCFMKVFACYVLTSEDTKTISEISQKIKMESKIMVTVFLLLLIIICLSSK